MKVDRLFSEPALAQLYDAFCVGRRDFDFYLPLVMSASSVLDVGCGTGELLSLARRAGHEGRLYGLDPAEAMLDQARRQDDVEWIHGHLGSVTWVQEFDLIVMTGHAFQVLTEDAELAHRSECCAYRAHSEGSFVFETRNPSARGWEEWVPENAVTIEHDGAKVRMEHEVGTPVEGELVSFTATFSSPKWGQPMVSRSTLRFVNAEKLAMFLSKAGLTVKEQFGDWDRSPLTDASPEIITVATRG
ncbi:MAG: methyltransferase domain-containing protein [Chloroflexi bacterium]|nr:methyltransferase domain-containing protein [Chloroflexota bacterium]